MKALGKGRAEQRPPWNLSGFGSNDTGVERDTQKVSFFDRDHPLDLSYVFDREGLPGPGLIPLGDYIAQLSSKVPFTFRWDKRNKASLSRIKVDVEELTANPRLDALLLAIHGKLPRNWCLTLLPGKVVLYLSDQRAYKAPIWRLTSGGPISSPDYGVLDRLDAADVDRGDEPADEGEDSDTAPES
jgi:hypothetical protein